MEFFGNLALDYDDGVLNVDLESLGVAGSIVNSDDLSLGFVRFVELLGYLDLLLNVHEKF
jgi:hypothetical protein